ncbi:O-methyltransferase [Streptantibioticus rubrisoli]|uniref:Class I SAM-dependent methyltransferase n=1 Tax=Streptantibioticus rubrisoli TaxID=1387313 RepID=A0ABT1PGY2_9ACTN|nr:class I SAM-dependent methyltransferase [Streptantibioticus rubrisoli]MCQ4044635.1 class I SAM-dependent methyltransferase [Streptantibioticus rubrisoli]
MTETKSPPLTPELYAYVREHNPPLDPVQRELVDITHTRFAESAGLQIAQEQGPLLSFLVRLIGARQIVEVGTFTGFSTLSMARALPEDGRIIACDISEEWTSVGREAWAKAGVADRIDLRIAPALDTLRALPDDEPWIDLSFLDADKGNYPLYWEELVRRTRPGGLLVVDNTLMHGGVTDPNATGSPAAIRAFNDLVLADERVEAVLLTVADGVTLARRVDA